MDGDPADAEPDAPRQAVMRRGGLRLLGGDCANAAAAARVVRDDDRTALPFASPPYGNQRDDSSGRRLR